MALSLFATGQSSLRSRDLLDFYRTLGDRRFTVVDVETTGHAGASHRIIELSVLQATLQDGVLRQETLLLNPQVRVPYQITRLTNITQRMVDTALPSDVVLTKFLPLLQEGMFVAHNAAFDYGFLQAEYARQGTYFARLAEDRLCTVGLARLLLSELPSRSLPYLVKHFGFEVGASHRAAADTLACWLLLERLLQKMRRESDAVLLEKFGNQWLETAEVAVLLHCHPVEVPSLMHAAGVSYRSSRRGDRLVYRRGDVEKVAT